MDRTLWPAVMMLLAAFGIFECSNIDLLVQDQFHDFENHQWIVDAKSPLLRWIFYTGPKTLIILTGIIFLVWWISASFWKTESTPSRSAVLAVVATLVLASSLVGIGKATTNVFTPHEVRRYGGFAPYVKACGSYAANDRPPEHGHGFPAGHASGGFALMSLAGLARSRRGRWLGVAVGFALGGSMGTYQMLKGAHYLSHTVVTAFLCWILFLTLRRALGISDVVSASG